MKNSIKRITRKEFKALIEQYNSERLEKKRNSTFFAKYTKQFQAMLDQQSAWVSDKIEKQEFSERFNEIGHDMQDDIERFINEIEDDCSRRDWTASDRTTWSLMCQNID
jgi:small-conductance mechanosensitive channel